MHLAENGKRFLISKQFYQKQHNIDKEISSCEYKVEIDLGGISLIKNKKLLLGQAKNDDSTIVKQS